MQHRPADVLPISATDYPEGLETVKRRVVLVHRVFHRDPVTVAAC